MSIQAPLIAYPHPLSRFMRKEFLSTCSWLQRFIAKVIYIVSLVDTPKIENDFSKIEKSFSGNKPTNLT